jgi:hypothetical protein
MVAKHAANEPWYSAVAIGATITSVDVPEPGSMFALSAGALGLLGLIRRKKS